jgi:hypothetical protein
MWDQPITTQLTVWPQLSETDAILNKESNVKKGVGI